MAAPLKTISRSAIVAFSPSDNLLAAGTVSGSLDSSFTSSTFLEIYKLDFASQGSELPLVGSCVTSESLCRLSWSAPTDQYPSGLIAGSLADGAINIWDPAVLLSDHANGIQSVPLANLEKHQQRVQGLDFNPITPQLLASGGSDGIVYIWDLTDVANAKHFPPLQCKDATGTISFLSWNRKVQNILATSFDGSCVVWDLKKQKHILKFSDPSGSKKYSALQWHPEQATKLVVAVEDDNAPYLQVWDLRNSSQPAQQLSGHTKGILSLAWCPNDSSIIVSCGKDNRTLCWDVSGEVIGELPGSGSWNFDVQWSPRLPGILSTSSFDGKIGIYNIESCSQVANAAVMFKAPKWLRTPVGTSFGFGGKLATFACKTVPGTDNFLASEIKLHSLTMEEDVVQCSEEFEAAVSGDRKSHMKSFSHRKATESESEQERELWEFLKIMLEEDGGRKALLNQLGFQFTEKEIIPDDTSDIVADVSVSQVSQLTDDSAFQVIDDGEDFFENLEEPKSAMNGKPQEEEEPVVEDSVIEQQVIDETDETIEQALIVGNFRGAVEHCLSVDRLADALVIAYAGGSALWEKTRNEYLKRNRRSYLQVVSAIATHDLTGLVESRSLSVWKETLALLGTYCRGDEWSFLVDSLASRLDSAGNIQAAAICYICAGNVEKTIEVSSRSFQTEKQGKPAVSNLQDLVEKSIVLAIATDQRQTSDALASVVERYAEFLANQGLLDSATVYLSLLPGGLPSSLAVLQDRIRRSGQVADVGKPTIAASQTIPERPQHYQAPLYAGHVQTAPSPMVPQIPNQPRSPFMRPPPFSAPAPSPFSNPRPTPTQYSPFNTPAPNTFTPNPFTPPNPFPTQAPAPISTPFSPSPPVTTTVPDPARGFQPTPMVPPRFTEPFNPAASRPPPFNPVASRPPPQQVIAPQPLISHLTPEAPAAPAPSAPPPPPTIQSVDTSSVKDELKPVVGALRRLWTETCEGSSSHMSKREMDDHSKKLGVLFAKLNSGDVSPDVSGKLIELAQALDARNYPAAVQIQSLLTAKYWDEVHDWLTGVRRLTKSRQVMG